MHSSASAICNAKNWAHRTFATAEHAGPKNSFPYPKGPDACFRIRQLISSSFALVAILAVVSLEVEDAALEGSIFLETTEGTCGGLDT